MGGSYNKYTAIFKNVHPVLFKIIWKITPYGELH